MPKKGGLGHFADLRGEGGPGKKGGGGGLKRVDTPMHTMNIVYELPNNLRFRILGNWLKKIKIGWR